MGTRPTLRELGKQEVGTNAPCPLWVSALGTALFIASALGLGTADMWESTQVVFTGLGQNQ